MMTRIKRSARGVAKGILRYRFVKKRKVLPRTRTDLVPSSGKTVAPDRNSVGPLQDKEYPTVVQTFQDLTNVMSKAYDIIKEMEAEQIESISLVKVAMEEATSLRKQMVELSQVD